MGLLSLWGCAGTFRLCGDIDRCKRLKKGTFLYSAVSSPYDCSKRFTLLYTAEGTVAMWSDQICQRFEATAVGFETGFSRLRVQPSNDDEGVW